MFGKQNHKNQIVKAEKLINRKTNLEKTISEKKEALINAYQNIQSLKSKSLIHYIALSNSEQIDYYKNFREKSSKSIFKGLLDVSAKYNINTLGEAKLFFVETASEIKTDFTKEYEEKKNLKEWAKIFSEEWNKIGIDPWKIQEEAKYTFSSLFYTVDKYTQQANINAHIIEKGSQGEKTVKHYLEELLGNQAKIYYNRQIKYGGKSTEIDAIIVSIYGVYLVEIKNIGDEYSKYKLVITPDGQFLCKYPNGKTVPHPEKNIAYQLHLHYSVFSQLMSNLEKDIDAKLFVYSLLVFSNDNIQIENQSSFQIARADTVFQYFSNRIKTSKKISEEQLKSICNIIETNSVENAKYKILDIYTTLENTIQWGMKMLLEYQKITYCLKDTYYW